ncbi:MAG: phosphate ABC transporter permease PstA, partial [Spirochaetales bacterium]|nr:phosphate ABC transporter permease PstA [Spirochaetales bacterium]
EETEGTALRFRAWIRPSFLTQPLERRPLTTGIRTALLGTVWIVTVSLAIAFPIGVATAVFLTEYDRGGWFSRFVRSNIETMASIPSIIYGILGLALFVRTLGPITSGAAFGVEGSGTVGRTVLSAALTLAILVLPSIVINSRDILEQVPRSYREACYAVGASRSAVVLRRILPAVSGQLITVLFLGISRVIGETAPLLVVGAAAFISVDPQGVFSRFTALPAQVFYWSARPGLEYQRLAAAAIIVLLALSTTINLGLRALGKHLDRRSSVGVEERETGDHNAR